MQLKKFTPSKAKLPNDEKIVGGDVPVGIGNQERKEEMNRLYERVHRKFQSKKIKK
ncbi:MAG: hypothetical protein NT175_06280 [Bacteroidetes bacterium]|nr:hypothetical protein [Bacteroidota bacterium]